MSWIMRSHTGWQSGWTFGGWIEGRERKRIGAEVLVGLALAAALGLLLTKPIHQAQTYHEFVDGRAALAIPNVLNVLSNMPFVLIGMAGLLWLRWSAGALPSALRNAYATMLAGTLLTGIGSAYYHWAPSDMTLVWDRLPMAIAFAGLFAAVIGERISMRAAKLLLAPLLAFGLGSVVYWQSFDDLRPYILAQFFPLLAIPLMLWWFPAMYSHGHDIIIALGLYVGAKLLEAADGAVYQWGQIISGHSLKHLLAAVAAFWLLRMLQRRQPQQHHDVIAYGSSSVSQYR